MGFLRFALERYNDWIFIALMMTGLYIVIARGNLVKKLIGLNVFQTSVFIFYISIGKIRGGTAPIYLPDDLKAREHAAHGLSKLPGKDVPGEGALPVASLHDNALAGNNLESLTVRGAADAHDGAALHLSPDGAVNALPGPAHAAAGDAAALVESVAKPDAHYAALDIVYSNPLPHVLILTAIVVGVATTAVGLALAVRIREAYGTIEEDELEAADNIAEFGKPEPSMQEGG
jgi:multicomponent Na+:H+ antiporter subunit C